MDDEFISFSTLASTETMAEILDNDLHTYLHLDQFSFEMPATLFSGMNDAKISFEIMLQVSEKIHFAYHDLLRKIEVI